MTTPEAWPVCMAVRTFTWNNTRSMATSPGRYSRISALTSP